MTGHSPRRLLACFCTTCSLLSANISRTIVDNSPNYITARPASECMSSLHCTPAWLAIYYTTLYYTVLYCTSGHRSCNHPCTHSIADCLRWLAAGYCLDVLTSHQMIEYVCLYDVDREVHLRSYIQERYVHIQLYIYRLLWQLRARSMTNGCLNFTSGMWLLRARAEGGKRGQAFR